MYYNCLNVWCFARRAACGFGSAAAQNDDSPFFVRMADDDRVQMETENREGQTVWAKKTESN